MAYRRYAGAAAERVAYDKLTDGRLGESYEEVRARAEDARDRPCLRFISTSLACKADTRSGPADVRAYPRRDDAGASLTRYDF